MASGHGNVPRTRAAVRDAGFLSARIFRAASHRNPYIVPDDVREPEDWYALPTLIMMGRAFDVRHHAINDTGELIPHLEQALERTAVCLGSCCADLALAATLTQLPPAWTASVCVSFLGVCLDGSSCSVLWGNC